MKGRFVFAAVVWLVTSAGTQAKTPGPSIEITQGPVNRVVIRTESQAAATRRKEASHKFKTEKAQARG